MADVLASAGGGDGQIVLIEGEAGIGKSRLLSAALDLAAERGFAVYQGQAYELDRDRPFQAVADALGLVPEAADPLRAQLGRLVVGKAPASGRLDVSTPPTDLGFRIVEGIVSLLEALGSTGPVALGLDDLHAADSSSLRAVLAIGRRLPHLRVALLCTLRPSIAHPHLDRAVEELLGRGARRLGLVGLDRQAVEELVVAQLGAPPGPRLSTQVGGAAGNPLFVKELIAALNQEGAIEVVDGRAEVASTSLPPSLRLTMLRRLSFLPSQALDVLRVAAVLGRTFSVGDLSAAVGFTALELLPTLRQAVAAGVVGEAGEQLAFRHDLVREAIYEDVPLALRKELHRQVGQALAGAGAPAVRVANQLSMGASAGDMEAVTWLRRAAREVAARSPAQAAGLLERALALLDPDGARDEVVAELVSSLIQVGRAADVARLAREVLAGSPVPAVEVALRRALGEVAWAQGHLAVAVAELEAAAGVIDGPESERAAALALAANARFFLGDPLGARAGAERAREEAERLGDDVTRCSALQILALAHAAEGTVAEAEKVARAGVNLVGRLRHPRTGYLYPHLYLGLILLDADRFDDAEATLQEGRRLAEERGATLWLPLYQFALAFRRILAGEWDDGEAEAETGLVVADEVGTRLHAPFLHGMRAWTAIQRGELATAEARLEATYREFVNLADPGWVTVERQHGVVAAGPCWPLEYGMWIQALLLEAKGDDAGALADLEKAWNLSSPLRYFLGSRLFGPDLVRLAVRSGHRQKALEATNELEEGARRTESPSAHGAALRCRGLVDSDPDVLLAAVCAYRRAPRPFDTASASEDAARALARAGRHQEATPLLHEAVETYERLRAARAVSRVDAFLRSLGVRRGRGRRARVASAGWESLTDSELAVVGLVAEGLTNRQIGERLFVSRRTVETHLAHVFAKLGVATRAQVAAEVSRRHG